MAYDKTIPATGVTTTAGMVQAILDHALALATHFNGLSPTAEEGMIRIGPSHYHEIYNGTAWLDIFEKSRWKIKEWITRNPVASNLDCTNARNIIVTASGSFSFVSMVDSQTVYILGGSGAALTYTPGSVTINENDVLVLHRSSSLEVIVLSFSDNS
jgi:hypothetical protein